MAEAFFRTFVGDSLDVVGAAIKSDSLHPLTNDVMKETGVDISGTICESIEESLKEKGRFDWVITICDAANERHPIFPFTRRLVHWSIPDPASAKGSAQQELELLRRVRDEIRDKVTQFIAQTGRVGRGAVSPHEEFEHAA